jgi:hypothetical protein
MAKDLHATVEELLEEVFSMQSMPRLRDEDQWDQFISQKLAVSHQSQLLAGHERSIVRICYQALTSEERIN